MNNTLSSSDTLFILLSSGMKMILWSNNLKKKRFESQRLHESKNSKAPTTSPRS